MHLKKIILDILYCIHGCDVLISWIFVADQQNEKKIRVGTYSFNSVGFFIRFKCKCYLIRYALMSWCTRLTIIAVQASLSALQMYLFFKDLQYHPKWAFESISPMEIPLMEMYLKYSIIEN